VSNIINAKVKFVRNLKDFKFETSISNSNKKKILKICLDAVNDCELKAIPLDEVNQKAVDNLIATDLLEQDFAVKDANKGLSNNQNLTIQINGENHIEIFSVDSNIYDAYSKAKQVDKKLCNKLNFAYSDKYGFLNPDIKKLGSGMTIELKILLPALAKIGALKNIPKVSEKLNFDIVCLDRTSGLCVIKTNTTLGYTEKEICEITNNYIDKIIKFEIETCKRLAEDSDTVKDKSNRAIAILKNCIKTSAVEVYNLIGDILISINSNIENDIKIQQINKILNIIKLNENNFKKLATEIQKILK